MDVHLAPLMSLALALGVGLLIGVERERRKGHGPSRQFAGVRTFTLAALLGAGAQLLDQPWLTVVAASLVATLAVVSHLRGRSTDPGVTTEMALFLTFMLGMLSVPHPAAAAGGGVLVAGLLAARGPLQQFSTQTLTEQELRNALVLAGAALIILPLTPDRPWTVLAGVNPRKVWQLVVMILAVQMAGDVALRVFGARLGLALSGLVSGFVSSTATIATMGGRARQHPELRTACLAGAWFSTVSTTLMLLLIAALLSPALLPTLLPAMGSALLVALLLGALALLALLFSGMATLVAWIQGLLGTLATLATAALAGFADTHSAAAAVMGLSVRGEIDAATMLLGVLLAFSANSLSKVVAAYVAGGARYGTPVSAGLLLVALAAWGPWAWMRWFA